MPDDDVKRIHDTRGGDPPRHHHPRPDGGDAFLPDPLGEGTQRKAAEDGDDASTDFGDELGQEFVNAVTGNVDMAEQQFDQVDPAETGGPYVITSDDEELADDVDATNPAEATREPYPTPMRAESPPSAR